MSDVVENADNLDGASNDQFRKLPSETANTVRKTKGMIESGLERGADYVSALERRIRALENENAELRRILETGDSDFRSKAELTLLEIEVAEMIENGKAPELYGERADKKEKPPEFLQRVYGKYLEKGREAIYLDEIRKLDPKFVNVLAVTCNKSGVDISGLVPLRTDRTERVMESVMESVGSKGIVRVTKALHAVKMRKLRG